ncbi:MAG TPA: MFS transporter [Micromonosporaceae bacterium]|nr:MFS transporter [Micromonosporaceae bacterium]
MSLHRDGSTWLIYVQLSLYAYFLYAFAPTVTLLRDEEHVRDTVAGLHGTAYAAGVIVVGLLGARILDAIGRRRALWMFLGTLCVSITIYASVPVLPVTLVGALLCGASASGVTITVGAALVERHGPAGPAAVTEANALAAAAGLIGPLLVGASVHLGYGWRPAVLLVIVLIAALFLLRRLFGARDTSRAAGGDPGTVRAIAPTPRRDSFPPSPDRTRHRPLGRQFWLGWSVIVLCVGVEFSMTLWAAQLLRDRSGAGKALAATGVTAIVGGMCLGRALGSRLARRYRLDGMLFAAFALTAVGFALFWFATTPVVAFAGLAITGLGMAVHYPLSLSRTIGAATGQADRASSIATLGTGIAIGVAPFLLGFLSDTITVRYAFLLVPVFLVLATVSLTAARSGPRTEVAVAPEPAPSGDARVARVPG